MRRSSIEGWLVGEFCSIAAPVGKIPVFKRLSAPSGSAQAVFPNGSGRRAAHDRRAP
jgi:hypothetical protein